MEDVILQYTYPRLDAEVSKHRNHLLKAPFCIHPKTGRVCVPVDPATVDDFDPERVPTVVQLLQELDEAAPGPTGESGEHHSGKPLKYLFVVPFIHIFVIFVDWEQTSLKPYVDMLDKHVVAIMNDVRRNKRGESSMTFLYSIFKR